MAAPFVRFSALRATSQKNDRNVPNGQFGCQWIYKLRAYINVEKAEFEVY